jgi:hypothetical protein
MLPETKPARLTVELRKLPDSLMFRDVITFSMLSQADPFQLPLMLQFGPPTEVESLATAEPLLTMESSSLESLIPTGESKTVGEQVGENQDSSDLTEEIPVLSAHILHIPPSDSDNQHHSQIHLLDY